MTDHTFSLKQRDTLLAMVMVLPAVLYIVFLLGIPIVLALVYSLNDVTTGSPVMRFIGIENFTALLDTPDFLRAIRNTFVITLCTLIGVLILGTIQAELLARPTRAKWLIRFLILLPWTAPASLSALAWLWMLDSTFSPVDWILRGMGLLGHPGALFGDFDNTFWLGRSGYALFSIILVNVWRLLPLGTVIILAGLNGVPRDILEQTEIDGAGYFRRMFDVILPMLIPVFGVTILFTFVFVFTDIVTVFILTRGGPANATQVLPTLAFFTGVQGGSLGRGAATALFLLPVLAAVSILILALIRRREI
ncbi:sugar ABC transporter permease [Candidimonas sp. SYP-B2681]|uniref:carbohydrate ABC transporter permease n=1 Tax=Candidimonas sp. SYP-B2681 TaxID=2497686 RepID=UPI000F87F6E0|nr:sugar ABC transporter permease [Candidimonas sp. SYP-B2681]RTZ45725.1 sugar ABC transporter permease [Candidimonas sp. SYP-B2681]